MLPYHLRPPTYGGKLKKRKRASSDPAETDLPYRDGGPVQRALQRDLLELQSMFFDNLSKNKLVGSKVGVAFSVFKDSFRQAKTALLHTRTCPPRIDRGAYEQLIYAACLNTLHKSCVAGDNVQFRESAFAVFALYAMHMTCTLPRGAPSGIASIPMGLQDEQNPKAQYRRAFRQKIRIDCLHYLYLLRVRDSAIQHVATYDSDTRSDEGGSLEMVALSKDVEAVIGRILDGNVQLCSYTGPMGLEALAGHSLYPFPESKKAYQALLASKPSYHSQTTKAPLDESSVLSMAQNEGGDGLKEALGNYLSKRQAIRLPKQNSTHRTARIREALSQMFDKSQPTPLAILDDVLEGRQSSSRTTSKKKLVTFEHPATDSVAKSTPSRHSEGQHSEGKESTKMDLNVVLPSGVSASLGLALESAVRTLMERDHRFLWDREKGPRSNHENDVSTLGRSHFSAGSLSMPGNQALAALLARAGEKNVRVETPSDFFLESQSNRLQLDDKDSDLSDLSDEEDAVSVATTSVGRLALDKLLSKVAGPKIAKRRASRKVDGEQSSVGRSQVRKSSVGSNDSYSNTSMNDSMGEGRAALQTLLEKAASQTNKKRHSSSRPPVTKRRKSNRPPRGSGNDETRTKEFHTVQETSVDSGGDSDSLVSGVTLNSKSKGQGETALLALLSKIK